MRRIIAAFIFVAVLIVMPSLAQAGCEPSGFCADRLIDVSSQSADNYSSWVTSLPGQEHLWCNIDVSAHNASGTVTVSLHMCYVPGDITGDCTTSTTIYALTTGIAAVSSAQVYVGSISPGFGGGFEDRAAAGPLPPVWRLFADHASGAVADYTVDCWWK